jgi:hypothetical protein
MKMLAGNRHLPTWGPEIWNAILDGTRVVITTPQILLDALDHAYINMGHLALIIFDEGMFVKIVRQKRQKEVFRLDG